MSDHKEGSVTFADQIRSKRVGLALSTGFFGFYHHTGVLLALEELGIKPVKLTGSSAGALVAAMYATGLCASEIQRELLEIKRGDFWDVHWPFAGPGFGLLAGQRFKTQLSKVLKVHRFEDCPLPLCLSALDMDSGRVEYFSSGPLIPAVYASCAFPYLFTPAEIDGRRYLDGGVGEKTPLVPFMDEPKVDVVLVSYMSSKRASQGDSSQGLRYFLPRVSSLFVDTPVSERVERDKVSIELLRQAGIRALVLAPRRVPMGPFSLQRASAALERGYEGALHLLKSSSEDLLGTPELK